MGLVYKQEEYVTVIPDSTLALDAVGVGQRTRAGVGAQTFPTVADPGFTEVTHCPLVDKNRFYISGQNKKTEPWLTEPQLKKNWQHIPHECY